MQYLHDVHVLRAHGVVVLEREPFEALDEPPLHVPSLSSLHGLRACKRKRPSTNPPRNESL
jgi:hypothetical protein